jgi:rod shape-determining protein MreD
MLLVRAVAFLTVLLLAVVLQVSFFGFFSYDGVVPNLVLLVVVGAALARGPELAVVLGFVGGLLVDLAPPADHVAGRWALALVVGGYLAGRVRSDAGRSPLVALATVAATSFIATSVFALSGLLLGEPAALGAGAAVDLAGIGRVILVALLYDLLLAPFVLPPTMALSHRLRPHQVAY